MPDIGHEMSYVIPEQRGMTLINTQASTGNYYSAHTLSITTLDWTVCLWMKLSELEGEPTIISVASEGL